VASEAPAKGAPVLGTATAGTFVQDNSVCEMLIGEDIPTAVETYLRCGYFTVPELHSEPEGKKIKLPVVVVRTASASPASDPLVVLQGGPGGSAIREYFSLVVSAAFRPAQDRDVILVDQRGAFLAQPSLSCPEYREVVIKRVQSGASPESAEADRVAANEACRKRLTDEGVNLAAYNSFENAADIAALPNALGYGTYNLYGISYGSLLAQHILVRHPQNVRSVILDGVMPRSGKFTLTRNANFQKTLQKVAAACEADALCKQDYPNIVDRFLKLIAALDAAPEPMKIETRLQGSDVSMDAPLTGNRLLNTMYYMLYDSLTISRLPRLVDLVEKKDYAYLGRLRNSYELEGLAQTTFGLSNSILCSEDAAFTAEEATQADDATRAELNVFRSADEFLKTCQIWNVPALDATAHAAVTSDVPVLALNGEFDPTTPPESNTDALGGLRNVTAVTFKGMGHGQLNPLNKCAATIVGNFLNAPTAKQDVSCIEDMTALEFSTTSLKTINFTDAAAGVGSVRPVGWLQIAPGQFVDDVTVAGLGFQVTDRPDMTGIQRALEQANARRIASRTTQNNSVSWTIYEGKSGRLFFDYAVSKDGTYFIDLVTESEAQRQALYESVFLPAIDAFVRIKSAAQTIVLTSPSANADVTSPVSVSGITAKTPFENNLVYRIFNGENLIIAEGPINVKGELGQPGAFNAALTFTVTQRTAGRIEVVDIDVATGDAFATAAVSVTLTPLNLEAQRVPILITISAPVANTVVTSPLNIKGGISLTPFENNLAYRIIDASGAEIGSGPITTVGELGKPATFDATITFTPSLSGTGRLFVEDINEAGGPPFATAAIDLQFIGPEPVPVAEPTPETAGNTMTETTAVSPTIEITPTVQVTATASMTTTEVTAGTDITAVVEVVPAPTPAPAMTTTAEVTVTPPMTLPAIITPTLPASTTFDLKGVELNPTGVAQRVSKRVLPAVPYNPNEPPGMNGLPTRVQYSFDRDRVDADFAPRQRQVLIMPVEEYRTIYAGTPAQEQFDKQVSVLKELLATKSTSITGEIPLFPALGAAQVFAAQVKYLDFEGGSCVRFVTMYSQDASPVTDDRLFYTCQGLTSDGKFLVSFTYPVSSVATPASFRRVPASIMNELEKDPASYYERVIDDLNKLSARGYRPYLNRLDTMVQSLTIVLDVFHRPLETR
jgi:pimeloyl-ACP methyl ester carboxylesterase